MTEQKGGPTSPPCPECGREPDPGADQPLTHCEWCGAEYPIPGQDDLSGDDPDQSTRPPDREET